MLDTIHHQAYPAIMLTRELTLREEEVIEAAARGLTNAKIAQELGIAPGTVKSYMDRILFKLGAANRAEAVAIWLT